MHSIFDEISCHISNRYFIFFHPIQTPTLENRGLISKDPLPVGYSRGNKLILGTENSECSN